MPLLACIAVTAFHLGPLYRASVIIKDGGQVARTYYEQSIGWLIHPMYVEGAQFDRLPSWHGWKAIVACPRIRELDLNRASASSRAPDILDVRRLPSSLEVIRLCNVVLTPVSARSIERLPKLRGLGLSMIPKGSEFPDFSKCPKLEGVYCSSMTVSTSFMGGLLRSLSLKELLFYNCDIDDSSLGLLLKLKDKGIRIDASDEVLQRMNGMGGKSTHSPPEPQQPGGTGYGCDDASD